MKIKVLFKRLDKSTGEVKSMDYKSFDLHDPANKTKVLVSIYNIMSKEIETESIFQIETFNEHEVTELDIF